MTKSADDTELLTMTKLKKSIGDLWESHSEVDQDCSLEVRSAVRAQSQQRLCALFSSGAAGWGSRVSHGPLQQENIHDQALSWNFCLTGE